jgi:hypothetical protein
MVPWLLIFLTLGESKTMLSSILISTALAAQFSVMPISHCAPWDTPVNTEVWAEAHDTTHDYEVIFDPSAESLKFKFPERPATEQYPYSDISCPGAVAYYEQADPPEEDQGRRYVHRIEYTGKFSKRIDGPVFEWWYMPNSNPSVTYMLDPAELE